MPMLKERPGRKRETFSFPGATRESIATAVANVPKPEGGFPPPEAMTEKARTERTPKKRKG